MDNIVKDSESNDNAGNNVPLSAQLMDDNVLKPQSFRISKRVKNKFDQIAKESGLNQDATLASLTQLYEIEKAKELTGRSVEIESFSMHLAALSDIYRMSLQLNEDAECRVHTKYSGRLEAHLETIQSLQADLAKVKQVANYDQDELKAKRIALKASEERIAGLVKEIGNLDTVCQQYKDKNDTLNGLLAEYKEDHEDNRRLQASMQSLENSLTELKREFLEKTSEVQILKETVIELTAKNLELSSAKQDFSESLKTIADLERKILQASDAVVVAQKAADNEKKAAVLETKEKYAGIIEEMNEKHNAKYQALLEELERVRSSKTPEPPAKA